MAFNSRSLALFNSTPYGTASKTVNWYGYASSDAAATVIAAGYFNEARAKLKVNDVIFVMSVADGVGDFLILKVVTVPGAPGDITVAVNSEAAGT